MKKNTPETQKIYPTENLHGSTINEYFHTGILKGLTAALEFIDGDTIKINITTTAGRTEEYTRHYFTKKLAPKRILVGYTDSMRDLCIITVYDFGTKKVFAFIYTNQMVTTARGSFSWDKT